MRQKLARLLGSAKSWAPTIARDAIGLAGGAAIVTGVGMIAKPAAWITGGLILIAVAVLLARKTG